MSLKPAPKPLLKVVAEGKRCSVKVPTAFALDLVTYLRGRGLQVGPPTPSSDGLENIEVGGQADAASVQSLLVRWAEENGHAEPRTRQQRTEERAVG
jgi:hypothetical protein